LVFTTKAQTTATKTKTNPLNNKEKTHFSISFSIQETLANHGINDLRGKNRERE
jgi:hypothetical protein